MQLFKKAIALLILLLFILYFLVSPFISQKPKFDLSREKAFGNYRVTFIISKQPLVGQTFFFGYYLEDLNNTELTDARYSRLQGIEIRKDSRLIASSGLSPELNLPKDTKPDFGIKYEFNETGIFNITSRFDYSGQTLSPSFLLEVKTKQQYDEERLKGAIIVVFSFIAIAFFLIYLYEKLEKTDKNSRTKENKPEKTKPNDKTKQNLGN